ncbi:MAG: Gfo/Idh/MocA family oxidoreductase [Prolixibacteraceae bacterium]|nr:Gfo/Idh/MocA family oxidoreductase [Prolixibacteraceae bacterium]
MNKQNKTLKFAILGCGFWSQFQLGGWQEMEGVECVALFNRTKSKADALAKRFHVPATYDDAEELFKNEDIDFVDIITDVDTHAQYVALAAQYGKDVICQKPMAPSFKVAKEMMKVTREAGVKFYVHENYRWQPQIRRVKEIIDSGVIGTPFRCNSLWNTAFPLFETQPFLASLEQFALTDQGSHQFDVLRYLFGEAETMYTQIQTVNPTIKGEDVATSLIRMKNGMVCVQQISFSSPLEKEIFPQLLLVVEGDKGSIRLDADYHFAITVGGQTSYETMIMQKYPWQTERLEPEPPSIVACNNDILQDMLGHSKAETTGADNFGSVKMVWAAYESARLNAVIKLSEFQ